MTAKTWNGKRLRQLRLRKGWSQDQLARAATTSQRNIVRWEKANGLPGAHTPGANSVGRLAAALEVDEGDFFSNGSSPDEEEDESELATDLLFALRAYIRATREPVA